MQVWNRFFVLILHVQFKLLPMFCEGGPTGCDAREAEREVLRVSGSAAASPGYFSIGLQSNTSAELTATSHTAMFKFTYSNFSASATAKPVIVLDLTNDLSHSFVTGNQTISFTDTSTVRVTGSGEYHPSFGGGTYVVGVVGLARDSPAKERGQVYFCLDVPQVSSAATWVNTTVTAVNNTTSMYETFSDSEDMGD